jgi:hypothetical protein
MPRHLGGRLLGYLLVLFLTYELIFVQAIFPVDAGFPVLGALSPFLVLTLPLGWIGTEVVCARRRARRGEPVAPGQWRNRLVVGELVVVTSVVSALVVQGEYPTDPRNVPTPQVAVWFTSPDVAAPRPRIAAVTDIGSIYRTCGTSTAVRLVLPAGTNWRAGQTISVGVHARGVDGVTADFGEFAEEEPAPRRVLQSDGFEASVFTVPATPSLLGGRPRPLRLTIEGRWGATRSFGSCTVALPALLPLPGADPGAAGRNAEVGLRKAGVDPAGPATGPLTNAENTVRPRYAVLRDEAYPPPDVQYENRWSCSAATASPTPGTRCDAVTPVEDPMANNLRAFLLLLAGTMLAFGVQLVYEHRRHYGVGSQ